MKETSLKTLDENPSSLTEVLEAFFEERNNPPSPKDRDESLRLE
jgi:hypothetical protein